ncbi:MAG: biopolymer transporter ExbD [Planctomycetota bacterium]
MSVLQDIATEEHKMEMTPMIDVTFLLLIFFLCTLKFKVLEGKLSAYLPKDVGVNSTEAEPREKVEIMIRVVTEGEKRDPVDPSKAYSGDGPFEYVGRVLRYSIGPQATQDIEVLTERLDRIFKLDKERPATVDPRQNTTYGDVVPVIDAAIAVGFRDITFVGSYE